MRFYIVGAALGMIATAICFLLLFAAAAIAGVTVTPKPGESVLHNADNSIPAGYTKETARFKTPELCAAAVDVGAKAGTLKPGVKCDTSVGFTFAQDCEGEKPPHLYLSKEKSPEDGKDYWVLPGASWTADTFIEVANLYVHAPTWPAGYPNCWVRGEAPRDDWRLNSKDEPGKAFMEMRTPDMPAGDLVAEEPNDETPAGTPAGFQEEWDARQVAAAAACAAGDTKQCPQIPNQQPGACGDYRSAACGGPGV